ncbi:MAG: Sec63 [Bogoriella megaspora]|nr:MAG: Sec63 [Bogoriella megaspora]
MASSPAFQASQRIELNRRQREEETVVGPYSDSDQEGPPLRAASSDPPFLPEFRRLQASNAETSVQTGTPIVQGIQLIQTAQMPDRFRSIFPFRLFNAVQSKCFPTVFRSNGNFVLASPTGSGKTAVLEMAICKVLAEFTSDNYKIIYQAPTKSLCSERQKDWEAKFGPLGIQCAELTGDSDQSQLRRVQGASIIVTTPEKWDSVTRNWKDHRKLMELVRLFLIDEVHIVKESRGATLEAVVSRMKTVVGNVRFVALSATVPNSDDVAKWLGRDGTHQDLPAVRETFNEDFRPVKLQKHVVGFRSNGNDHSFDNLLDNKITSVVAQYSQRKPIMIFCFTRKSTEATANQLANWWRGQSATEHYWSKPRKSIHVEDARLQATIPFGVAFHHAGVQQIDRHNVENGFLNGDINVICCTGTLAMGVNLPCHLVIIKGTVTYQNQSGATQEYSDLEIMQMLGRAGRPQFDDSAVAVIMTRSEKVKHYEKMVSGQEILESCLHRNLIEHLNAEIELGTIYDLETALTWLRGTFLYVRLQKNPTHYRLDDQADNADLEDRLERILNRDLTSLMENELITRDPNLACTELGKAMTRCYLQFDTMKVIVGIPNRAKTSEIVPPLFLSLSALAQASEFREIRFRAGEKPIYKEINRSSSIKFIIPVDLSLPAHKVSLIIQSVLGSVEFPSKNDQGRHSHQMQTETNIVFQHVHRLIRCIIDCKLSVGDAVGSRNALMLSRSLAARAWDDSPLQLKQLDRIGIAAVRRFVAADIKTIEELEGVDSHRIETILNRAPPFGMRLLDQVRSFPKLRVSVKMQGSPKRKLDAAVTIDLRAEIGFINETAPTAFKARQVYVCFLAETSDGRKLHFWRVRAVKLSQNLDIKFSAELTTSDQCINCYVMCDDIAGTLRQASLQPQVPPNMFPLRPHNSIEKPNTSRRRTENGTTRRNSERSSNDEFGDGDIPDTELIAAAIKNSSYVHIDDVSMEDEKRQKGPEKSNKRRKTDPVMKEKQPSTAEPRRLRNGRWACNHRCKDKTTCKHLCCREGLEAPPKSTQQALAARDSRNLEEQKATSKQQSISQAFVSRQSTAHPHSRRQGLIEDIDLTELDDNMRQLDKPTQKARPEHTRMIKTNKDEYEGQDLDAYSWSEGDFAEPTRVQTSKANPYDAGPLPQLSPAETDSLEAPHQTARPRKHGSLFIGDGTSSAAPEQDAEADAPPSRTFFQSEPNEAMDIDEQSQEPPMKESSQYFPATESPDKAGPSRQDGDEDKENEMTKPELEGIESWLLEEFGDIIELV